jgi:16S rRNA (guanine966-N2)-methyltransferase
MYRGRKIGVPRGDRVRPTQDRVREALFSMLKAELPGSRFLDLFAGTGAVGLEALSRGAAQVIWVEGNREVHRTTLSNVTSLAGEGQQVVCCPVERWLRQAGRGLAADLVFADPPYSQARATGLAELAAQVVQEQVVAAGGLLIAELPRQAPTDAWPGWRLLRDRAYGHTRLVIAQRMEHAS